MELPAGTISTGYTVSAIHSLTIASIPKHNKPLVLDVLITGNTLRMSIQIVIPEIFYKQEKVRRSIWDRIRRDFKRKYDYITIETRGITIIPPITDGMPFNARWTLKIPTNDKLIPVRFNQETT